MLIKAQAGRDVQAVGQLARGLAEGGIGLQRLQRALPPPSSAPTLPTHGPSQGEKALKQGFRETYGVGVIGYLRDQRLWAARTLMIDHGVSVLEAALQVGYASPSHFARLHRRWLFSHRETKWARVRRSSVTSRAGPTRMARRGTDRARRRGASTSLRAGVI